MIMLEVCNKLDTLKKETSKIEKVNLLKEYLKNDVFRIIVELTYDETLHYNVGKLPQILLERRTLMDPMFDFDRLVDYLLFLSEKQGASLPEKKELAKFGYDKNWKRIITCIINKDLKCGAGSKLINQAVPDTITIVPYMRCSTSDKKNNLKYPAFFQTKEDGLFVNIIHNKNKCTYFSRNGNEFIFPEDSLTRDIMKNYPKTILSNVYMGELRCKINGKWLPRKTSNGIVNKALKKNQTMSTGESFTVHFICWDIIPHKDFLNSKCKIRYEDRFKQLSFFENANSKRTELSKTTIIHSFIEAQAMALQLISEGEEGGIVKNFKALWKNTTSTEQIKLKAGDLGMKNERECELQVVDWFYGKEGSKYENCLGGLLCISADDLLETRIGGGFSDDDRGFIGFDDDAKPIIRPDFEDWVERTYTDKIITARFNEVIKAKTSKKHSLFSARFIEIREDKNVADTLEYIKEV